MYDQFFISADRKRCTQPQPAPTRTMICRLRSLLLTSFLLSRYSNCSKGLNVNILPASVHGDFALPIAIITFICRTIDIGLNLLQLRHTLVEWGKRQCNWRWESLSLARQTKEYILSNNSQTLTTQRPHTTFDGGRKYVTNNNKSMMKWRNIYFLNQLIILNINLLRDNL